MTIQCNLVEQDYRAMRRYVLFKIRKLHWFYGVIIVFFLGLDWLSNKPGTPIIEKFIGLIGMIMVWVIMLVLVVVAWKLITKFSGGRFKGTLGPHVFEITGEGIVESHADGKSETKLTGIRQVVETPAHFFVLTKAGQSYVLPKRDFTDFSKIRLLRDQVLARRG